MNVSHLQLGISDTVLMVCSDGAYGEVQLRPSRKFEEPRLRFSVHEQTTRLVCVEGWSAIAWLGWSEIR